MPHMLIHVGAQNVLEFGVFQIFFLFPPQVGMFYLVDMKHKAICYLGLNSVRVAGQLKAVAETLTFPRPGLARL